MSHCGHAVDALQLHQPQVGNFETVYELRFSPTRRCLDALRETAAPRMRTVPSCNAGNRGELTAHEFFILLYLLDLHSVNGAIPSPLPAGTFPPGVHLCYMAAGAAVPVSLRPPTVAHVPLAEQNPVENLNLQAEGSRLLLECSARFCAGQRG
jgi:hypothetical protein